MEFGFTPAREQDIFNVEPSEQSSSLTSSHISGEEARQFYEHVIEEDKASHVSSKTQFGRTQQTGQQNRKSRRGLRRRDSASEVRQIQTHLESEQGIHGSHGGSQTRAETAREISDRERRVELQGLRFLRCAHEGDLCGLRDLLSKGVDINFQDNFFWTALMCASWSGQRAAVKLLLQRGAAWVGVVDTQGRDARDLAMEAQRSEVLVELEGARIIEQPADGSAPQRQWCDVCRSEYTSSRSSHLSSTLHQFSLRRPPPTPYYCLPPSANSYRMMVRCGWKPGTGLGPEGGGPQQPVPTVLKRDQKGLGFGQTQRARVTHFQARDHEAVRTAHKERVERRRKGKTKEESRVKEQQDKSWERDFRASFYL